MKNDIEKIIDELKNDNDSLKKYIECFIEIEKVKEENSKEYQELKEMIEFDDEYKKNALKFIAFFNI